MTTQQKPRIEVASLTARVRLRDKRGTKRDRERPHQRVGEKLSLSEARCGEHSILSTWPQLSRMRRAWIAVMRTPGQTIASWMPSSAVMPKVTLWFFMGDTMATQYDKESPESRAGRLNASQMVAPREHFSGG